MTDLSPDLIDKAKKALYDHDPLRMECHDHSGPCCPSGHHDVGVANEHRALSVLEAVADDLRAEGATQALRAFADAHRMPWTMFLDANEMPVTVGDLLRAEADRIEHDARCPHTKCPGGSLCCCADRIVARDE